MGFQTFDIILSTLLKRCTPVQVYANRIKNKIAFKIKTGHRPEVLFPETMKLLGSTKRDADQDKDGEDVPKLEYFEVVLVHCNLVHNSYQQASKVLFTFVANKQFSQLFTIAPFLLTILDTTNTKLLAIEVWFTDQNSKLHEIEDNFKMTLIIG